MALAVAATDAPSLVLHSPVDVCAFVDDLGSDAAGELVIGGRGAAPAGSVYIEGGRVCWAAARGLARRLSDLLAASTKLDAAAMEALYRACKRERAPLGEYLVGAGLVTAPELRWALLKHTAESLHSLCAPDTSAEWVLRRSGGYNSRFTFKTTELLSRTFAEAHRAPADLAHAELAEAFGDEDWGAAFVRSASRAAPDPIAVHGNSPERVETLLRLGRWAASAVDVTSPLHDDETLVAVVLNDRALVAWRTGATLFAGCTGVHGPARLLNRRARARRRKGPSHGGL